MKFSVIMPTFNRGHVIERAIDSVMSQSFQDFELIIVDDGSTDNTKDVVEKYASDKIKYYCLSKNMGANHARNYGMRMADGEYFAFLDSDNEWHLDYLSKRLAIHENENVDFTFGNLIINSKPVVVASENDISSYDKLIEILLKDNVIDTNTVCMKRACWEGEGGFNEELKRLQDWEYFFRIIATNRYIYKFCNSVDVEYYTLNDSISNMNNFNRAKLDVVKKRINWFHTQRMDDMAYKAIGPFKNYNIYNDIDDVRGYVNSLAEVLTQEEMSQLLSDAIECFLRVQKSAVKRGAAFNLQRKLINIMQEDKSLQQYFANKAYKKLAIYGYGLIGKLFFREMSKYKDIRISCVIDRNSEIQEDGVLIINEISKLSEMDIDCIVITVVQGYEEIKKDLTNYTDAEIVFVEEVFDCALDDGHNNINEEINI